jgi:hypothetical protein
MRNRVAGVPLVAVIFGGCSLLIPLRELERGPGTDAGVAREDAGADGSGPQADTDAAEAGGPTQDAAQSALTDASVGDAAVETLGPNLHTLGTFEDGCNLPWDAFQGTLAASPIAHTGTRSCRVCVAAGAPAKATFSADDNRSAGPAATGARYLASAWVRADDTLPAGPVALILRAASTSKIFEGVQGPNVSLDTEWRRLQVTLAVTTSDTFPNVVVRGEAASNATGCFLLDDVTVQKIQ